MDNKNQPNKDATDDWRKQLQPDSRKAMVIMMKGTLQGHFPKFGAEELVEHIAGMLEEEILTAATSQSDYLRLIFLKMRTMETIANNTGFGGGSQNLSSSQRPMQLSSGLQPSQSTLNQQLLAQQNQQSNRFMLQKQQQQQMLTMQQQGAKRQRQQYAMQSTQQNNIQASSGLQASQFAFQQQMIGQKSIMTSPCLQSSYQPNQFAQQSIMTSSGLQQQLDSLTNMQQGIQTSGGSMSNQQSLLDPKQVVHSQNPPPAASPMSTDAATIENATVTGSEVDVLEEVYEAIKSMSENYLTDLRYMFLKIYQKCQPHDALPQFPESEQVTRLKTFKAMLSRMIGFLRLPKSPVPPPSLEDKLASYEKQILNILNSSFQTKPGPRQQQIPQTGGHQLSLQRRLQQPLQQKIQPLTMHQQGVRMPQQQYEQVSANMLQLQQQQIQQQHQLQQQILQQQQLQQQTQLQQQLQQQTQLQQQLQQQIQQLHQLQQQIQQQHQLQNQLPYCCTPTLHTSPVTAATTTVAAAVAGAATTTVTSEQLHQPQQQIQHSNLYQSFERH